MHSSRLPGSEGPGNRGLSGSASAGLSPAGVDSLLDQQTARVDLHLARRDGRAARLLAGIALFAAIFAVILALLVWQRVTRLTAAHNRMIGQLNQERSGTGAVLDALGVPLGREIGDAMDSVKPPSRYRRGTDSERRR